MVGSYAVRDVRALVPSRKAVWSSPAAGEPKASGNTFFLLPPYLLYSCYYAPNFEKVGDILVSACPYVRTYSCSRYRLESLCMDSSWKNSRRAFLVFPELSPLVKLRPFDKQGDEIL